MAVNRKLPLQVVAAALVALMGLLGLAALLFGAESSVREHVRRQYQLVSSENGGRSSVYSSPRPASRVVGDIADEWQPADRVNGPTGYFLRYQEVIVAVLPSATGSRIHVDDATTGYRRWYGYVGGFWGTYSGRAEGFRGGGPGAGK